ncbi:MAG TPA: hypothetical protein VMV83_10870 [Rectinemataceae bacterium]|nr:hypothetical protein [Rectinemataceae bacterium]
MEKGRKAKCVGRAGAKDPAGLEREGSMEAVGASVRALARCQDPVVVAAGRSGRRKGSARGEAVAGVVAAGWGWARG